MTGLDDDQYRRANREAVAARGARLSKAVLANVVLLTMIAPLATDMYVPAFPIVGDDLQAARPRCSSR